jgi:hypothetical protein
MDSVDIDNSFSSVFLKERMLENDCGQFIFSIIDSILNKNSIVLSNNTQS